MQVTTSSSPLFSSWESPDSQGPAAPDPMASIGLAGQDIAPALPGVTAAPSPTPKADPLEIAALELLLAEPANQDMVQRFGGPLQPLPTGTDTGQGIQARYGADLGARLNQLQTAQQAVRAEYYKAWESAAKGYGGPGQPGWLYTPETKPQHFEDYQAPARWDFDPTAFTRHYASGDSPAQKAFAQLHGSEPLFLKPAIELEFTRPDEYVLDDPRQPTIRLSATDDDARLKNKEYLWFDPVHGWTTEEDNLKGDWIDKLSPVLMGGFLAFCTGGMLSSVMGVTPGSMTVAQSATIGAASSAAVQLATTGKLNFGTMLRSALTAGAATGIMDASGMGDMLKAPQLDTRALGHLGKAGMQGVLQQAIGGKFKDGFTNSLLASAASEVGAHLDQQIAEQLPDLGPAQASALKLLGRAAASALRIVGSNDPAASFANDFLMGALQDTVAQGKRGKESQDDQEGAQQPGTAQGGEKPSSGWVDRLGRSEVDATTAQFVEAFNNPAQVPVSPGVQIAQNDTEYAAEPRIFNDTGNGRDGYFDSMGDWVEPPQLLWPEGEEVTVRATRDPGDLMVNPHTGLPDFKYTSVVINGINASLDGKPHGEANTSSPTWRTLSGVVEGVGTTAYEMLTPAADLLQVGNEIGRSWITGEPLRNIEYISTLGQLAAAGASTTDIVNAGFVSLIRTPDRILQAYEDGDYEQMGRELGGVSLNATMAAFAAKGSLPSRLLKYLLPPPGLF